jgi:hypothetical protein
MDETKRSIDDYREMIKKLKIKADDLEYKNADLS